MNRRQILAAGIASVIPLSAKAQNPTKNLSIQQVIDKVLASKSAVWFNFDKCCFPSWTSKYRCMKTEGSKILIYDFSIQNETWRKNREVNLDDPSLKVIQLEKFADHEYFIHTTDGWIKL